MHNRLYNLAETRGWLYGEQAGFHKLRSCDDQIVRTTQPISDGFQAVKPQRSLMAVLDFSKIFRSSSPAGCATFCHIERLSERGDSAPLRQGLPLGVVLSLLLFLLYIDDLRSVVPETVKVALLANDVSLISSHHNKLVTEKEL